MLLALRAPTSGLRLSAVLAARTCRPKQNDAIRICVLDCPSRNRDAHMQKTAATNAEPLIELKKQGCDDQRRSDLDGGVSGCDPTPHVSHAPTAARPLDSGGSLVRTTLSRYAALASDGGCDRPSQRTRATTTVQELPRV